MLTKGKLQNYKFRKKECVKTLGNQPFEIFSFLLVFARLFSYIFDGKRKYYYINKVKTRLRIQTAKEDLLAYSILISMI